MNIEQSLDKWARLIGPYPMFGDGKVEGIEDDKLTITFAGHLT